MRRFGLIGHPVGHSQSPALFQARAAELGNADSSYELFDLPAISDFPTFVLEHPEIGGLNVTVPHKQSIIPLLSSLSHEAERIGAVNTLEKTKDGWVGHNTDAWGFQRSIQPFLTRHHERALVLGTGGSAAAVKFVLGKLGIDVVLVSRQPDKADSKEHPVIGYDDLNALVLRHHRLVVNCTPLGMPPLEKECAPLPFSALGEHHLVVDLVYNPEVTELLRLAKQAGASTMNGRDMLRLQAEKAWEIWGAFGG